MATASVLTTTSFTLKQRVNTFLEVWQPLFQSKRLHGVHVGMCYHFFYVENVFTMPNLDIKLHCFYKQKTALCGYLKSANKCAVFSTVRMESSEEKFINFLHITGRKAGSHRDVILRLIDVVLLYLEESIMAVRHTHVTKRPASPEF